MALFDFVELLIDGRDFLVHAGQHAFVPHRRLTDPQDQAAQNGVDETVAEAAECVRHIVA